MVIGTMGNALASQIWPSEADAGDVLGLSLLRAGSGAPSQNQNKRLLGQLAIVIPKQQHRRHKQNPAGKEAYNPHLRL